MTFKLSVDSSIFISQLTGEHHAEAVLAAMMLLETLALPYLLSRGYETTSLPVCSL